MLIDREYFNAKPKLQVLKVNLSDKKEVYVREITAAEQRKINEHAFKKNESGDVLHVDNDKYNEMLVAMSICDKAGNSLLSEVDYGLVSEKFSTVDMTLLLLQCIKVNRLNEDVEKVAGKS